MKCGLSSLALLVLPALMFGQNVLPVLNVPLSDRSLEPNAPAETIALNTIFGTELIDDQVVRFTTQESIGSLTLDFALFSNRTPGTRTNFLNYVNDGDYLNSIIHRSVPDFVIQGGGFYHEPSSEFLLDSVPTDPAITNEYGISNTEGTISMAKQGGDPDSATSQWFISLGDNSENLDNQNGGFTVFARITQGTLSNAEAIAALPVWNAGGALNQLPLDEDFDNSRGLIKEDFVLFDEVELVPIPINAAGTSTELNYSIFNNSNPSLVTATISNGASLLLTYTPDATGTSILTVRATDSVGNTVDDTITISIPLANYQNWTEIHFTEADQLNPAVSGPEADTNGDGLTNLELYLHDLNVGEFHGSPVVFSETRIDDESYTTFTFPIRNDLDDISYEIQQNLDLNQTESWTAIGHTEVSRIQNDLIDTVTIQTTAPGVAPKDFYRIRFVQTP